MNPMASKDFPRLQSFCCQDWIIQLGQLGLLFLPWVRSARNLIQLHRNKWASQQAIFLERHLHRHNRYWSRFQAKTNHNQPPVWRTQMSQIYPNMTQLLQVLFILLVRTKNTTHVKQTIQRVPYAKGHIREPTAYLWTKRPNMQYFLWSMFRSSVVRETFAYWCTRLKIKSKEWDRDVASNSRASPMVDDHDLKKRSLEIYTSV